MLEIKGATLAQVSYVAANLRPSDLDEFHSVYGTEHNIAGMLAHVAAGSIPWAYAAVDDGQPLFLFGVMVPITMPHMGVAWGFGTKDARRAIPVVGRFIQDRMIPDLLNFGVNRVEVRVLADAKSSVHWLANYMGAQFETTLEDQGVGRETFLQYAWTRTSFEKGNTENVLASTGP